MNEEKKAAIDFDDYEWYAGDPRRPMEQYDPCEDCEYIDRLEVQNKELKDKIAAQNTAMKNEYKGQSGKIIYEEGDLDRILDLVKRDGTKFYSGSVITDPSEAATEVEVREKKENKRRDWSRFCAVS